MKMIHINENEKKKVLNSIEKIVKSISNIKNQQQRKNIFEN